MDYALAALYDSALAGNAQALSSPAPSLSPDGQRVQVALVMASIGAPVPENLGIVIETTYEELVQTTVPIRNLEAIAADGNVQFVQVPARPIPTVVLPDPDNQNSGTGQSPPDHDQRGP